MAIGATNSVFARPVVWIVAGILVLSILILGFPTEEALAYLLVATISALVLVAFRHYTAEKDFITKLFLSGLALRLLFGIIVHVYDLRSFFGGDAMTYDLNGSRILDHWFGYVSGSDMGRRSC